MISRSVKWSSALLFISGILTAGAALFHPGMPEAAETLPRSWGPVHFVLGLACLLAVFGLAGLYSVMRPKITLFGLWAFGLAILGSILLSGLMLFVEASLIPALAADPAFQPLMRLPLVSGGFGFTALVSFVTAAVGWLFLAGYLMGTKTVSGLNGLLLIIAVPLLFFTPPLPLAYGVAGGVLLGAGIAWLGISLWTGAAHAALRESMRLSDECFIQAGGHA